MSGRNYILVVFLILSGLTLHSQNRIIINPGFEPPLSPISTNTSKTFYSANSSMAQIKGWNTTASDAQIEIWFDGMGGFRPPSGQGKQWVELNANLVSRLYQNLYILKGEAITWSYYHRGRESSSIPDEMELCLYSMAGEKVASLQKAATTNTEWKKYTGTFTSNLPDGIYQFSFESIRSGLGNLTVGNFIDGVQVGLAPLIEFTEQSYSGFESSSKNVPRLIVNGTVPHGGIEVTIKIEKGDAILREDYLFPNTFEIPYGHYSPATIQTIPITIINDNIHESNESIKLSLTKATGGAKIMDANFDRIFYNYAIYTILDDDTDTKTSVQAPTSAMFNNKKITTSDTVNLNILFEQGSDIISATSEAELNQLLDFMRKNSHAEIELEGHTEKDESTYTERQIELNQQLSEKRVVKIKKYLIDKGIEDWRIKTAAFGGKRPISNDPAKNRRVVMRILKL